MTIKLNHTIIHSKDKRAFKDVPHETTAAEVGMRQRGRTARQDRVIRASKFSAV